MINRELHNKSSEFFYDCFGDFIEDGEVDPESAVTGMIAAICMIIITLGLKKKGARVFREMADKLEKGFLDG